MSDELTNFCYDAFCRFSVEVIERNRKVGTEWI